MSESEVVFNIFYALISFCIIYPPAEFVSAGLTINQLFSSFLGSETITFVQYHVRRTCVTLFILTLLPLSYVLLYLLQYNDDAEKPENMLLNTLWTMVMLGSLILPALSAALIYYWSRNKWGNHPIVKTLQKYSNQNTNWASVAADINSEYRRDTKISIIMNPISKLIATENWIIKTSLYHTYFAHQSDTALIADKSDSHEISQDAFESIQFVNIQVKPTRTKVPEFTIRINALEFKTLQDRVARPITVLSSVKFHISVLDRFVEVFKEQVALNPKYSEDQEITDTCFACMLAQPNIKIQKNCEDIGLNNEILPESSSCHNCYCRPMWCIDCLARWFASRQNQGEKEFWLQQRCTCPMCRAPFCILDVCFIEPA